MYTARLVARRPIVFLPNTFGDGSDRTDDLLAALDAIPNGGTLHGHGLSVRARG